jgi:hypothetical protein
LPEITAEDWEGAKPALPIFGTRAVRPLSTKQIGFELEGVFQEDIEPMSAWKMSFSLEDFDVGMDDGRNQDLLEFGLKRSESARLDMDSAWSLFDIQ